MFLNVQGLKKRVHALEFFLISSNISVIFLTEHVMLMDEINLSFPSAFHCDDAYCRTDHVRGGSPIFVHNDLLSKKCDVSQKMSVLVRKNGKLFCCFQVKPTMLLSTFGNIYKECICYSKTIRRQP